MSPGRPPPRRPRGAPGAPGQRPSRPGGRSARPARGAARRPPAPRTAAERRAAEVKAARPPRAPRDPDAERERIESRTVEAWIDEGTVRSEASSAAARAAAAPTRPPRARTARRVSEQTSAAIGRGARDARRAAALTDRLAQAQEALDGERFGDARRIALPLLREVPEVAAVHEVIGLAAYRSGRWREAATALETAQVLDPSVDLLPVLADVYRAQRRWADVERLWEEVRAASPRHEVLAEARMVVAGAQADQGDLRGALRTMRRAAQVPGRVRDHHLRQWYALADLHDRAGDTLEATRWFEQVAAHDPDFVDVRDRLRSLGR